jgi:hypothetical protein
VVKAVYAAFTIRQRLRRAAAIEVCTIARRSDRGAKPLIGVNFV